MLVGHETAQVLSHNCVYMCMHTYTLTDNMRICACKIYVHIQVHVQSMLISTCAYTRKNLHEAVYGYGCTYVFVLCMCIHHTASYTILYYTCIHTTYIYANLCVNTETHRHILDQTLTLTPHSKPCKTQQKQTCTHTHTYMRAHTHMKT
jgi:hypothetical protein